jgi:hypothetical protein
MNPQTDAAGIILLAVLLYGALIGVSLTVSYYLIKGAVKNAIIAAAEHERARVEARDREVARLVQENRK